MRVNRHVALLCVLAAALALPQAGASFAEVWSVDGERFATGDVDNDGSDELVVHPCAVYDCSPVGCRHSYDCGAKATDVWSMAVGDPDGEGLNELVLGGQGTVSMYDCDISKCTLATAAELLYKDKGARAVSLAVGDANNDRSAVLVVGTNAIKDCSAGRMVCDPDKRSVWGLVIMYVCTGTSCTDKWSYELMGSVDQVTVGDINDNERTEVVAAGNVLVCSGYTCKALGGEDLDPVAISEGTAPGTVRGGESGFGDLDGDGKSELVTQDGESLRLYTCDGASCKLDDVALPSAGAFAIAPLLGAGASLLVGNSTDGSVASYTVPNGTLAGSTLYASGGDGVEQLGALSSNGDRLLVARSGGKVRLFARRLEDGDRCEADRECRSGICARGACSGGAPGAPCDAAEDCADRNCRSSVCCAAGQVCCASDKDCEAGVCDAPSHTCGALAEGRPCSRAAECATGACTGGVCCAAGRACCRTGSDCPSGSECLAGECRRLADAVMLLPRNGTALGPGSEVFVTSAAGGWSRRDAARYPVALRAGATYALSWSFAKELELTPANGSVSSLSGPGGASLALDWRRAGPGRFEANLTAPAEGTWELVVDAQGNGVGYGYRLSETAAPSPAPGAQLAAATPAPSAAPSPTEAPSPAATAAPTPEPSPEPSAEASPEPTAAAQPSATPAPPAEAGEPSLLGQLLTPWAMWRLAACLVLLAFLGYIERAPLARRLDGLMMGIAATDPARPTGLESLALSLQGGYAATLRPSLAGLLASAPQDAVPQAAAPQASIPGAASFYQPQDTPYSRAAVAQAVRYDAIDRKELVDKLKTLKDLLEHGLITQEDYDRKKEEYLGRF